jgi:NAD(P)-dependent dehydrogenase (short-subunit alcohol dehydrogenase family)
MMKTSAGNVRNFIVTGATQGLGLAIARELARTPGHRVVLAVRDVERGRAVARSLGANTEARRLDLSSLADVARFVATWGGELAGLVNNAGVQNATGTRWSAEGFEETFAVNHLGALALTSGLLPRLAGAGRVLFIGSGTHNPRHLVGRLLGYRGARFTTVAAAPAIPRSAAWSSTRAWHYLRPNERNSPLNEHSPICLSPGSPARRLHGSHPGDRAPGRHGPHPLGYHDVPRARRTPHR